MSKAGAVKANILRPRIAITANDQGKAPTEIELLRTGMWDTPYHGMFMVTPDDLREYLQHFLDDLRPSSSTQGLPIDREHNPDDVCGWIMGLEIRTNADGGESLWGVNIQWTPDGEKDIVDGKFKFFSPEFCPDYYEDPESYGQFYENVLIGGGVTNRPLFKDLKPLMASDKPGDSTSGLTRNPTFDTIYIKAGEKSMLILDEVRKIKASDLTADQKTFLTEHKDELTDAERKDFGLEAAAPAPADPAVPAPAPVTANDKPNAQPTITASDMAKINAAGGVEALLASANKGVQAHDELRATKASEILEGHIKRGALKASSKEKAQKLLLASDATGTRADLEALLSELPDNSLITAGEKGNANAAPADSAQAELHQKTQEYVAAHEGVKYPDAQSKVLEADDALSKRVTAERSAR